MIVLFVILLLLAIILTLGIYLYIDECIQLRRRLLRLGVDDNQMKPLLVRFNIAALKEFLYEKETELAEECFLTVEKDV